VIGQIHIRPQNIFDLDDPREDNRLFRFANLLHVTTQAHVIERSLLFKRGDWLSVRRIEETERLLRENRYLYEVEIQPVAYRDGVVDLEVVTRDTWSLKPDISIGREGGVTSGSISIEEHNLLGTGIALGATRISEVDRKGTEFLVADKHAFGAWTGLNYAYSDLDTGHNHDFSIAQPFYALDVRSAASFSASQGSRIDSVYRAGSVVAEYRHSVKSLDASGGWSAGLFEGWARRISAGFRYQDDEYALDPLRTAPASLPADATLSGPYLRYEVIEDDFRKLQNFDLIERPEYFELGFHSTFQLGRALDALGSTRDSWLYELSLSDGKITKSNHILLASASLHGRRDELAHRQQMSATARYYAPQSGRSLFFASLSGAVSKSPDISDVLQLGGDSGLRGYPLRYQSGDQRLLLTLEQRVYSDWYPLRLFRVGGAVFYDVGRAWGGPFGQGEANPGWLSDVGIGLRVLSTRSAFGNVIHADLAFPVSTGPNIRSVQFVFKTRASF